jgi:hypothetical protein
LVLAISSKMKTILRRTLAVAGALVLVSASSLWGDIAAGYAMELFRHVHDVASVFGTKAIYKSFGDEYVALGRLGLCIAVGLSFVAIFWDARPTSKRLNAIFWIFLALLLPLAFLNYTSEDIFVSRPKQASIDILIVFLGLVSLFSLCSLELTSVPARALQILAIFFIAFQGVFVPAIFAILWLLNWERAISLAQTKGFSIGWVSAVASLGSLTVSVLQFRRTKPDQLPQPRITLN